MSEQKESSVLFSLKELMNLEEDRIRNEEADKAAQATAAEQARVAAERAAREAEEARIRAEEERRRQEESRAREETARLEAIRVAEIEKARVEAEQKARLQAMEAQQHHERQIAAIKHDESKKKLRNLLVGGAVAVVLIGGVATALVVSNANEKARQLQAQAEANRATEERAAKLERDLKEQQAKVDGLLSQLASAKDEATRLALQKQLEEERAKTEQIKKGGGGGPRPAGASPGGGTKPACNCTPGDPLCSCL